MMKVRLKHLFTLLILLVLLPAPHLAAASVPDTGQTKCYNDTVEISCPQPGEPFYGQDGNYSINPRSYTKLGYGDVELPDTATYADGWLATRDNVTGLIWEMKTDDGSIHDKDNTYTWCDSNPATNGGDPGTCGNGTDTEDFINTINDENFGGHDDWRLPTVEELSALVNSSIPDPGPVVALAYFPGTVSSGYWSSTTYANYTNVAWGVSFLKGNVYNGNKSGSYYARAVRAGQAGSLGDLVINGDGTVTDTATGLMWQQCSLGQTWNPATQGCDGTAISVNWQDALEQSENLTLAGYSDWRLPNRNELQSLVDYSRSYPSIDTTFFPGTKPSNYWSSTTYAGSTYYAWHVSFHYGFVNYDIKFNFYVRAVRAGQSGALGDLVISGLTPASGPVTGGTTVTVTGQNFGSEQGAGFVTFDGVEATITSWSDTEIVCVTPPRPAGVVDLTVTRDDGASAIHAASFTFFLPGYGFNLWPDTGQTKCYDNGMEISCPQPGEPFYGQDAQYAGPTRSYTKLGYGDVELPDTATYADGWLATRDNVTGLIWEMKTDDGSIHDKDNKYTWCDSNPETNGGDPGACGNGTDTEDFINVINDENFGGHDDWRLPTVEELFTLVNSSIPYPGPVVDLAYFLGTVPSYYWSSTTYADITDGAWHVGFNYGTVYGSYKSTSYYVRAVRTGQAGALAHLVTNGDGTVTDTATGLMWQQCSLGQTWNPATQGCDGAATCVDWQDALGQSENLNLAGYSDWRLPNRNELQSLVDYSRSMPAIDTTSFPDTVSSIYWSSTTLAYNSGYAWLVYFHDGHVYGYNKSDGYYVRAVRAGQSGALGDVVISGLTPASGPVAGGTTVTINGQNFGTEQGAGFVTFDGVEATITSWSDTEIVCTTPPRPAGAVELTVTRDDGESATMASAFTFFDPVDMDVDGDVDGLDVMLYSQALQEGTADLALADFAGSFGR